MKTEVENVAPPKLFNVSRSRQEMIDDILKCEHYEDACYRMAKIRCIREDIPNYELLFMELHIKLHYGYFDDSVIFVTDLCKMSETKDFYLNMVFFMSLEHQRLGTDGVREFRDIVMRQTFEPQRECFAAVAKMHPEHTTEIWLALLSHVNASVIRQLTREEAGPLIILQQKMIDFLDKNEETKKLRGLWNLGQSLIKTNFADMDDRKIQMVYELYLKSCLQELRSSTPGETPANKQRLLAATDQFVNRFGACLYFDIVMERQDGVHLIPTKELDISCFAFNFERIVPVNYAPVIKPFLQYVLTGARIQLPAVDNGLLYLPVRCLVGILPTRNFPELEENCFRDIYAGMSLLHLRISKFPETDEVIQFVDPDLYLFFALSHYYTGNLAEIGKLETHFDSNHLQYKVLRFCADLLSGKKPINGFLELVNIALERNCSTYISNYTTEFLNSDNKQSHLLLPANSLGQWLMFIAPQVLDICGTDHEPYLVAQLLIAQFELQLFGKDRLNYAWEKIKTKESLKTAQLDQYIVKEAVLHRFMVLSQKWDAPWNPAECYKNLKNNLNEQQILRLILTYLRDHTSELLLV